MHLNLTEGPPYISQLGRHFFPSLGTWIKCAYTNRLKLDLIEAEFEAQLQAFVSAIGKMPDFIDGHQHIHEFPGIRDVLLHFYEKHFRNTATYVRSVTLPGAFWRKQSGYIKTVLIQLLGARALKKLLVRHNIPHNTSFSGFYDFEDVSQYTKLFPLFLKEISDGGIIMCHPGKYDNNQSIEREAESDTIAVARAREYEYFLSDEFIDACRLAEVSFIPQKAL